MLQEETTCKGNVRDFNQSSYDMKDRTDTFLCNGIDRRGQNNFRRKNIDRRNSSERRQDPRTGCNIKRSFSAWIRSLTSGRLGVDRRKGCERRLYDRRSSDSCSLITREEMEALLE